MTQDEKWTLGVEIGVAVVLLLAGFAIGLVFSTVQFRDRVATMQARIDLTTSELHTESVERKTFEDGMFGCYERLGKAK